MSCPRGRGPETRLLSSGTLPHQPAPQTEKEGEKWSSGTSRSNLKASGEAWKKDLKETTMTTMMRLPIEAVVVLLLLLLQLLLLAAAVVV
jgi:hypothetical protein